MMAKKIKRKAAKSPVRKAKAEKPTTKAKKSSSPRQSEEVVNGINRLLTSLKGVANVVAIEGRPNNHRIYVKGEKQSRKALIGEIRPFKNKINLGLNNAVDNGKSFKKLETNFVTLASYEVDASTNISKTIKKVSSALKDA